METDINPDAVRAELDRDASRGVTRLAELASRYANDRQLVYRAVLLKRDIMRADGQRSPAHIAECLAILDALVADQRANDRDAAQPARQAKVDEARARTLEIAVPNAVVLDCKGIAHSYRRSGFSLKNVTMQARYGEIVGVVGLNGNGKTTLFRVILGELAANAGTLSFPAIQPAGTSVHWSRVRQQIAYVPQELPPWHGSLRSNLHYEAAIHGVRGTDNEREVDYIVQRLGLTNELEKRWDELSGGYRLRFTLAKALVWKPKLLILDEPLANLDFKTMQVVLSDLRHLADSLRYPLSVLVSSQHLHEIEEVSDKLMMLTAGDMKYFGSIETLGAERRVNRFELAGQVELAELRAALDGPDFQSLHYNGVAFILTAAIHVTPRVVLGRLLECNVGLTYFRDISRSSKSLLEDDGL